MSGPERKLPSTPSATKVSLKHGASVQRCVFVRNLRSVTGCPEGEAAPGVRCCKSRVFGVKRRRSAFMGEIGMTTARSTPGEERFR